MLGGLANPGSPAFYPRDREDGWGRKAYEPSEPPPDSVLTPHACTGDDSERDEWGTYPPAPSNAAPTWTKPHDAVHSLAIAHDHHVALRGAHVLGAATGPQR